MESLVESKNRAFPREVFWREKRVLLTGHTGFKGGWLAAWLVRLGARVTGLALPPTVVNSLYECARLDQYLDTRFCDVRDRGSVGKIFADCRPEIVIHLAGQSILRHSYVEPVLTYETNVIGTVNVLETARGCNSVRVMVMITSDKCYENHEWEWPYRENDRLGGHDPYSSSKACAELAIAAWQRSFFHRDGAPGVASARAGNVIGGGDWSFDRLIPDCIRAFMAHKPVRLRRPDAIRPWQHVLEPLRGYLVLAERLWNDPRDFAQGWNFGPTPHEAKSVLWVARQAAELWGDGACCETLLAENPHESTVLLLDNSRAGAHLLWQPIVDLTRALDWTIAWYRGVYCGEDPQALTEAQIIAYERLFDI